MQSFCTLAACQILFLSSVMSGALKSPCGRAAPSNTAVRLLPWSSEAELHGLPRAVDGLLTISADGVNFRPEKDPLLHWSFENVKTVELANPSRLSLVTYQNARWHLPGDRRFNFTLYTKVPEDVAADLVCRVGKPAINGDPFAAADRFASIPVRHKTRTGSSNGTLRFTDSGIDYLSDADDARSWRWSDIETLAHPEPYRLRIGGYLETFAFDLKQPLSNDLFDWLWENIYAQDLNLGKKNGGSGEKF